MPSRKAASPAPSRVSPGRPTREQQAQRDEELLNAALDIFLDRGFERTTMEEIATFVGMSKRTMYARYEDKSALFKAAVQRAAQRYMVPRETLDALLTDDLEQTLKSVARLRITNVAKPIAIKLQRILSAQSYRFPELFQAAMEGGTGPTLAFLRDLFTRCNASGQIEVSDARQAATAFLSIAVSGMARSIVAGHPPTEEELEKHLDFSVKLFLNGARHR